MRLQAKQISFRYQQEERDIWNAFDFSMESGERVGLLAPSGYGKTTLCKILAGYELPDKGLVTLDGTPLQEYRGYCPVQMIWQHPELAVNPRLRMKETLEEAGKVKASILEGLGIQPQWMDRFPGELSGGELQRFCIARALGEETRFLLADEITTMLDLITQAQIWQFLLEEVRRRDLGLLAVSHSEDLLQQICRKQISLEIN